MPTVTDTLETVLKLTGAQQYQAALLESTTGLERLAAAETRATAGISQLGGSLLTTVGALALMRRSVDFVNDSFQLFAEDDAIARRVAFALQQVKSNVPFAEFDKLAEAISRTTGFDDDLIRSQVEVLSRFKLTGDQIRTLLPLIVDVAAREGKGIEEVAQAVGLGLEGQVKGLTRLGLKFKDTGSEVRNYTKLLKELQEFQGAAASTLETPAGLLRQRTTEFENLKHAIGERFAPTGQTVVGGTNALLQLATVSVNKGVLGNAIGAFNELSTQRTALNLGFRLGSGQNLPAPTPPGATNAALAAPSNQAQRSLDAIEENTRKTHQTLLRGGGPTAQNAIATRELNQHLGVR